ncbi:MAG: RNA polymerase sigma factor [Planctomycetota bacterium]|nr:RNA polymerase sigma factor [Planctomycetota bacterium]
MSPSSENETLEAILQLAANGDEEAWREIVDRYSNRVFGLIRAQCGNADLAEEITQSAFCTMAAKIGNYTESGRFEPWLFRIAVNRLRDEMRRRKRHATPVEDDKLVGMAGAANDEVKRAGSDEPEVVALREAITQLSDADQQIIHLRHFGGLSFKQIADILEQPLGTVLARQHRALKKLKDLIESTTGESPNSGTDEESRQGIA